MKEALRCAEKARLLGEVAVGAVVVKGNEIVAEGWNTRETAKDITGHAEIMALARAGTTLGDWRLQECVLYVTLEPCLMCAGAILQSRIGRVVFGAVDEKEGAFISRYRVLDDPRGAERPLVNGKVLAKECEEALLRSFEEIRKRQTSR